MCFFFFVFGILFFFYLSIPYFEILIKMSTFRFLTKDIDLLDETLDLAISMNTISSYFIFQDSRASASRRNFLVRKVDILTFYTT